MFEVVAYYVGYAVGFFQCACYQDAGGEPDCLAVAFGHVGFDDYVDKAGLVLNGG
jgi:hypothetical protein